MEKFCKEGQATDDNLASAHCMLDTNTQIHNQKHHVNNSQNKTKLCFDY